MLVLILCRNPNGDPPTCRTFINERRQSWSALWWSLWKTSGCSSSRMASTLLKNAMWFCCLNSCRFRWMRPCSRPAIMGRCLRRKSKLVSSFKPCWMQHGTDGSWTLRRRAFIFLYLSRRTGCDTANFLQARLASADLDSPTSASRVTSRWTRTSSWTGEDIENILFMRLRGLISSCLLGVNVKTASRAVNETPVKAGGHDLWPVFWTQLKCVFI